MLLFKKKFTDDDLQGTKKRGITAGDRAYSSHQRFLPTKSKLGCNRRFSSEIEISEINLMHKVEF